MRKYYPKSKKKYLPTALFLLFLVSPAYPGIFQQDSAKVARDSVKVAADTSKAGQTANNAAASKDTSVKQLPDSVVYARSNFKAEELVRGERLFYGLAYLKDVAINCAHCHSAVVSDTMNWSPNALEISQKYLNKSALDLSRVLLKPSGKRMAEVHKDFHLSPEDIVLIKAYMNEFVNIGLKQEKPVITNLFLFIIAAILLTFSIIDLMITKRLNAKINLLILTVTGIFITYTLVINAIAIGRSKDYSPLQPVKFSHAIHAGQNQIECIYCHSSAPLSKTAGIPPVNVCMNCHLVVRNGSRSGVYEISKVITAYENQKPLQWVKVHNLPDHVFFSHAQHVTAGGLDCKECHGDVKSMDIVTQVSDLSMGWCVNCHRTRKVNFDNNKFYTQYARLSEKMKSKQIDSVTVDMIGGTECMKCHY